MACVGRKSYIFMGSEAGSKSAAITCTLIETAKMNKVNPDDLFAWVLERIQDHPANHINDAVSLSEHDQLIKRRGRGKTRRLINGNVDAYNPTSLAQISILRLG